MNQHRPTGPQECPGCGVTGSADGPTHAYIGASPFCWSLYGELLAGPGEKQDLVDAYAVQHPGVPGRRQIQSVGSHLISLCAAVERGATPAWRVRLLGASVAHADQLVWLEPPGPGAVRVADVVGGRRTGIEWRESVWQDWSPHHVVVRQWLGAVEDHLV